MYKIKTTAKFQKDLKRAKKRGYDLSLMNVVVDILATGEQLPYRYKDHALEGKHTGYRECHITPDWLLIYRIDGDRLFLILSETGTHSDLF